MCKDINEIKDIFALRLRQFAVEEHRISQAIERVSQYDDDDFSPSRYTPSRAESRKSLQDLLGTVKGYCLAADDMLDRDHGTTLGKWYRLIDQGLIVSEFIEIPDHDSGYRTDAEWQAEIKADKVFGEYLWDEDEE